MTRDVYGISGLPGKWVKHSYGNGYEDLVTGRFVSCQAVSKRGLTIKRLAGIHEVTTGVQSDESTGLKTALSGYEYTGGAGTSNDYSESPTRLQYVPGGGSTDIWKAFVTRISGEAERKESEMGNASICDREVCGKTFKADEEATVIVKWVEWYDKEIEDTVDVNGLPVAVRETISRNEKYVLCPKCQADLMAFLEKKPTKK
ncbi:MAG: hypothetical protein JRD89_11025 [Deltaproteobacteria bacterium]|nr:hypothetical protein [Deltaproteobacteria bacterium]